MTLAPRDAVRKLAFHEDASVAAPVLRKSARVSDADLIEIADIRGQEHLLAISGRETLSETLSDLLVTRGRLGRSRYARPESGCAFLGSRLRHPGPRRRARRRPDREAWTFDRDIPAGLLQELVAKASAKVRAQHLAGGVARHAADHQSRDRRRSLNRLTRCRASRSTIRKSNARCVELNRMGKLNDQSVNRFAVQDEYNNVVAALSVLTDVAIAPIERLIGKRPARWIDRGLQGRAAELGDNDDDHSQPARLCAGLQAAARTGPGNVQRAGIVHGTADDPDLVGGKDGRKDDRSDSAAVAWSKQRSRWAALRLSLPPPGRDADIIGGIEDLRVAGLQAVRCQDLLRRLRGHAGETALAICVSAPAAPATARTYRSGPGTCRTRPGPPMIATVPLPTPARSQAASNDAPAGFHSVALGLDGSGASEAIVPVRMIRFRRGELGWSSNEWRPCTIRSARSSAAVKNCLSPSNFNSSGIT